MKAIELNEAEQLKILERSKKVVFEQASLMRKHLDDNKLIEALKHASNMLEELQTNLLEPKAYYDLYGVITQYLRDLELYLLEDRSGKTLEELYEIVQYRESIIQRLYLLITVGSVLIKLKKSLAKQVLKDLTGMCRGVQHPMRGLFLRNYLAEMTKEKLPEVGSEYSECGGGNLNDCLDFLLENFTEMNKLWVRMQHQGTVRDRPKREHERRQISVLVGKILSRISRLEGVDVEMYKELILPKISEQIIGCHDPLAQYDLLDTLIQVTSDEWHLKTFKSLLKTISFLEASVDVKLLVISLLDRLAGYLINHNSEMSGIDKENIFNMACKYINRMIESRITLGLEQALEMLTFLMEFVFRCYDGSDELVERILAYSLTRMGELDNFSEKKLLRLLCLPLEKYANLKRVLNLPTYFILIEKVSVAQKRRLAIDFCSILKNHVNVIDSVELVQKAFSVLKYLIIAPIEDPSDIEDVTLLTIIVHRLSNQDPDILFSMIVEIQRIFQIRQVKDSHPQKSEMLTESYLRLHTYPSLIFACFRLVSFLYSLRETNSDWTPKAVNVIKYATKLIQTLSEEPQNTYLSLNLYLQAAQCASLCKSGFSKVISSLIEESFVQYEHLSSNFERTEVWSIMISTLCRIYPYITYDNLEDWKAFCVNSARNANYLLRKSDRATFIGYSSKLYWLPVVEESAYQRDKESLIASLNSSYSKAKEAFELDLLPFVSLINIYLHYLPELYSDEFVKKIHDLIQETSTLFETTENSSSRSCWIYFKNTLQYIEHKKEENDPKFINL